MLYDEFSARLSTFQPSFSALREPISRVLRVWKEPKWRPRLERILASERDPIEGVRREGLDEQELPRLLALDVSPEEAVEFLRRVVSFEAQSEAFSGDQRDVPEIIEIALNALALPEARQNKPRVISVSKHLAEKLVARWHSKLPEVNPRGLLFTLGVAVGPQIVAVATVNTPSGKWQSERCPIHGIIELSRVASDGSTRGASSMLAARAIDLLPVSGRYGQAGCLFVTYSLVTEAGTTYLALADKGLRPTRLGKGMGATGQRARSGDSAMKTVSKIRWEAGPAALPPDWDVMRYTTAKESSVEGAKRAFERWQSRVR